MIQTILTYAGIILTLFFGYLSIYYARKSKVLVSLTLKRHECFTLFKSIIKDLRIGVKYNERVIENPLILFRGAIINSGTKDIPKTFVLKPLKLILKEKYKWLEVNLKNYPADAEVKATLIENHTIQLDWDLLKKNEIIDFEALIERTEIGEESVPMTDEFYEAITFDYRITDLEQIEKYGSNAAKKKKDLRYEFFSLFFLICLGLAGFFWEEIGEYVLRSNSNLETRMIIENKTSSSKSKVELNSIAPNIIYISNDSLKTKLTTKEFEDKYFISSIEVKRDPFKYYAFKGFGFVLFVIGIISFIRLTIKTINKKTKTLTRTV